MSNDWRQSVENYFKRNVEAVEEINNNTGAEGLTASAQSAASAAAQKRWWKNLYPFMDSLNGAQHIDYFLSNPQDFVNAVLDTYDDLPVIQQSSYAADIMRFMQQLNAHDTALLHLKLDQVSVGPLGDFAVKIWPEIGDYFWLRWANEDVNAFLAEHLKNLANIPVAQRQPHIDYFKNWIKQTNATQLINSAAPELREQFVQVMELQPGTSAAAMDSAGGGKALLVGGLLLGGGLWAITAFNKPKPKRKRK